MPEHPKLAKATEPGRSVVVLDGTHRGAIARVLSAGGGVVQVQIAGIAEPVLMAAASVAAPGSQAGRLARTPQP